MRYTTSKGTHVPRLVLVILFTVIVCGPITGPQALFPALAQRGLFANRCSEDHRPVLHHKNSTAAPIAHDPGAQHPYPCHAQEQAIEWHAEIILSAPYVTCLLGGLVMDVVGAKRLVNICCFLWIVCMGCSGINPTSGLIWAACQSTCAIVSLVAYSGVVFCHLREACPDTPTFGFWCFICCAMWDSSVLLNIPLSYLFRMDSIPLAAGYALYAACGVPLLLGLMFGFNDGPKRSATEATQLLAGSGSEATERYVGDETTVAVADEDALGVTRESRAALARSSFARYSSAARIERPATTEPVSATAVIVEKFLGAKAVLRTPMIWAVALHSAMLVTVGNFLIAMMASFARSLGANKEQEHQTLFYCTIMMALVAVFNYIPGLMVERMGPRKGLGATLGFQCVFLALLVALLFLREHLGLGLHAIYVIYGFLFLYRIWGFGVNNPVLTWRYAEHNHVIGFMFGFIYTVAGVTSMVVGNVLLKFVTANLDRFVPVVVALLCAAGVVEAMMLFAVARATVSSVAGEDGIDYGCDTHSLHPQDDQDETLLSKNRDFLAQAGTAATFDAIDEIHSSPVIGIGLSVHEQFATSP